MKKLNKWIDYDFESSSGLTPEFNEYTFEVSIKLDLSVVADNEQEARDQLTDRVSQYFAETTITIDKEEAKLVDVQEVY